MSPKIPSLAAGLTALGLSCWSATPCVADEPIPPAPSPAPLAPVAPDAAPAPPPTAKPRPRVLLLSNGQVLQGTIVKVETGYLIKHQFGTIPKRRSEVEGEFASLREVFEYKKKQSPDRDPAELMKLARWCLDQKPPMLDEAREQLERVVKIEPDDEQARAMLHNLSVSVARLADRDEQVARTVAEVDRDPDEPGALDLGGVRGRRGRAVAAGPPVILDLPPALALKRYEEFTRNVHPMLQRRCAKCHQEPSDRVFRLNRVQATRDFANDALLRPNLDAVLLMLDKDDLDNSPLLAMAFKPHGPRRQPLFTGPNDPGYRALADWIASLDLPRPSQAARSPATAAPARSGGFATARPATPRPPYDRATKVAGTPGAYLPDVNEYPTVAPVDADFNTASPVLIGGPNAAQVGPKRAGATPKAANQAPADAPAPVTSAGGRAITLPDGTVVPLVPEDAEPTGKGRKFNLDAGKLQGVLKAR